MPKFDVVIQNPPYQGDKHLKHINQKNIKYGRMLFF